MTAKQRERGNTGTNIDVSTSADGSPVGNLMVYHQIYCLVRAHFYVMFADYLANHRVKAKADELSLQNLLRQHTYRTEFNYSGLPAFSGTEERVMENMNRCIETLRQTLMCSGDTTPYLIMLTPERPGGESPDFNTLHGCRKMDTIMRWSEKNAIMSIGGGVD